MMRSRSFSGSERPPGPRVAGRAGGRRELGAAPRRCEARRFVDRDDVRPRATKQSARDAFPRDGSVAERDHALHLGHAVLELRQHLRRGERQLRIGALDHLADFRGLQVVVNRHGDAARDDDGIVGASPVDAIFPDKRNAVALFEPEGDEPGRKVVRTAVGLGVGDAAPVAPDLLLEDDLVAPRPAVVIE